MSDRSKDTSLTQETKAAAAARTEDAVEQASETLAQTAEPYAEAARSAADEFQSASPHAQGLNAVADQIDAASDRLRGMDTIEIAGQIREVATRNPLLFLGGAALMGFAVARFMKASEAPDRNPWTTADPDTNLASRGALEVPS